MIADIRATLKAIAQTLNVNPGMVRDWFNKFGDSLPRPQIPDPTAEKLLDRYFNSKPGNEGIQILSRILKSNRGSSFNYEPSSQEGGEK